MNNSSQYPKPRFLSIVIGIIGALLLWMGVLLLGAGGSLYYAFAGIVLLVSAVFLFRGDVRGAQLYGAFLLFTYIWALYESGLDAWALMPRVAMFSVLGLWFLLPRVRRGLLQAEPAPLFQQRSTQATLGGLALLIVALFVSRGYEVGMPSAAGTGQVNNATGDWANYGSSKTGTRYAATDQINIENVGQLERAWEIRTRVPGAFKGTPIQIDDGLYLSLIHI